MRPWTPNLLSISGKGIILRLIVLIGRLGSLGWRAIVVEYQIRKYINVNGSYLPRFHTLHIHLSQTDPDYWRVFLSLKSEEYFKE